MCHTTLHLYGTKDKEFSFVHARKTLPTELQIPNSLISLLIYYFTFLFICVREHATVHVWSKNSFKNQFSLSTMWVPGIYITQVHQAYWQASLPTEPSSFHLFNISLLKRTLCVLSSLKTRGENKTTLGFSKPPKSRLASSCSGSRFEQPWWLRQQQLFSV